jgi:DNA-binding IclR family transcriptional regulator
MGKDSGGTGTGGRRGIQSVEIGLKVLQGVSALGGPSTLSAIAQGCEMAPPQVHRYLQSLIATGMAQQDPATGRYDLGPAALKLGLAALARTDAFKLVDRLISDFVTRTGETVQIAALGPLGPTIVRWYSGSQRVPTSLTVGSVLSLMHSATGLVFLCFASPGDTGALVKKEAARSPIGKKQLDATLAQVKREGRATVRGSVIPGLNATAFPIFDLQGHPILSATLLWPQALDDPGHETATEELSQVCREISTQLGWTGNAAPAA